MVYYVSKGGVNMLTPKKLTTQEAGGLSSVFFGGGTPSLVPPYLINKVRKQVDQEEYLYY